MNVYIRKDTEYYSPVLYVLKIIEKNKGITFNLVDKKDNADFFWDHLDIKSQIISQFFYAELEKEKPDFTHIKLFRNEQIIIDESGNRDYVATIFYMINCLQEFTFSDNELDRYGRFKYESSYQHRYGSIEENLVQEYIDQLIESFSLKSNNKKSTVFISHDIDNLYGSLLQDGFWAAKNLRVHALLSIIANELLRKPHWKNIDRVIRINSEYDIRSTFFWLVNNGKGNLEIKNADYNIEKEQKLLKMVEKAGFINGLHKSCSDMSIDDEMEKGEIVTPFNRYHFLNFLPSSDWGKISNSKLQLDASLGFAERYGFRNSFGNAFQPYNLVEKKPYDFIEIPLNIMDGTLHKYMKVETQKIGDIIIDFFENNKNNCCLSLLWHNTYFTDYKYNSFLDEYKKVLAYFYEIKIQSLTPQEIIEDNTLSW